MWSCRRVWRSCQSWSRQVSVQAGNRVVSSSGKPLHPLWLRERCLGPASVHQDTRQPLIQPHDLPATLGIESAELISSSLGKTALAVTFTDGHLSMYDEEGLENEIADFTARGVQQQDIQWPDTELWDASTGGDILQLQYADIMSGDPEFLFSLMERLLKVGHAIVKNVPSRDMEVASFARVVSGFRGGQVVRPTNWGPVFKVRSFPDEHLKDLAYTADALPPHVDNPYRNPNPGFQLLHVLENECKSGESLAVDGFKAAEQLRSEAPDLFNVLCDTEVRWENDGGDQTTALIHYAPHLEVNQSTGSLTQIRYSPKSGGYCPALECPETLDKFYRARRRLAELLNAEANTVRFQLVKGDLWIFNNLRVLHGRGSFNPSEGFRYLQGAYIDMDAVTSSYFRSKYTIKRLKRDCHHA